MESAAISLRPVQPRDFPLLRKLNSPLWQRIQLIKQTRNPNPSETLYTATEGCELAFQFSRPIREIENTLAKGRSHFRFVAARAVNVSATEGKMLIAQIQAAVIAFANAHTKS